MSASRPAQRRKLAGEQESIEYVYEYNWKLGSVAKYYVSHLYQDIVTIYVGSQRTPFYVYKELLCKDSRFFKAMLNSPFREGEEQSASLEEDEVPVFKVYQTWLNTHQLRYNFDSDEWWLHLSKLWIFADKIQASNFKNRVVDSFFSVFVGNLGLAFATADTVNYVYDNTTVVSYLRRLFIRFYLHMFDHKIDLARYPHEFILEALTKITKDGGCRNQIRAMQGAMDTKRSPMYHEECLDPCCRNKKT